MKRREVKGSPSPLKGLKHRVTREGGKPSTVPGTTFITYGWRTNNHPPVSISCLQSV